MHIFQQGLNYRTKLYNKDVYILLASQQFTVWLFMYVMQIRAIAKTYILSSLKEISVNISNIIYYGFLPINLGKYFYMITESPQLIYFPVLTIYICML